MTSHVYATRPGADPPASAAQASTVSLNIEDLAELRAVVAAYCEIAGLPSELRHRLVTAADEVAGNAVRHGAPPARACVWAEGDAVVCQVTDHGRWRPDPLLGYLPPKPGEGLGLWAVRALVDRVDIRTGATTCVRLRVNDPAYHWRDL